MKSSILFFSVNPAQLFRSMDTNVDIELIGWYYPITISENIEIGSSTLT